MNILEIELVKKFIKNKGYLWLLFEKWDNQELLHKRLEVFFGVLLLIAIQFIHIGGLPIIAWTMVIGIISAIAILCVRGIWYVVCEKIK